MPWCPVEEESTASFQSLWGRKPFPGTLCQAFCPCDWPGLCRVPICSPVIALNLSGSITGRNLLGRILAASVSQSTETFFCLVPTWLRSQLCPPWWGQGPIVLCWFFSYKLFGEFAVSTPTESPKGLFPDIVADVSQHEEQRELRFIPSPGTCRALWIMLMLKRSSV